MWCDIFVYKYMNYEMCRGNSPDVPLLNDCFQCNRIPKLVLYCSYLCPLHWRLEAICSSLSCLGRIRTFKKSSMHHWIWIKGNMREVWLGITSFNFVSLCIFPINTNILNRYWLTQTPFTTYLYLDGFDRASNKKGDIISHVTRVTELVWQSVRLYTKRN